MGGVMGDARVVLDHAAIAKIAHSEDVREQLLIAGERMAGRARAMAPVRTHGSLGGAASIRAEAVHESEGWTVRVSWDSAHPYMRFTDLGTIHIPAQHYLEEAAK